ncbi:MAG: hypothetical protein K2Q21_02500 [Chitinophagaceae bacterium]|nr:hypothetical protein [Chitinophagaceae bacterium]
MKHLFVFIATIACCFFNTNANAQRGDSLSIISTKAALNQINQRSIDKIQRNYALVGERLLKADKKILYQLENREIFLKKKLTAKDSLAANRLFKDTEEKYAGLFLKLEKPVLQVKASSLNQYFPHLDSLQTAFHFFDNAGAKIPGMPVEKIQQVKVLSNQLKGLQAQLQASTDIQIFIKERKQLLMDQLAKYGMSDQFKKINKQVYYYQQQINEYKTLIRNPDKLAEKALSVAQDIPAFKEFMSKNSFLAQCFPMPEGYGTTQALQGLQTRSSIQNLLIRNFPSGNVNPQQFVQQQALQAQNMLNTIKDKANKLGGGTDELTMPDFKPNNQKTKSFLKRLEYNFNIQSQRSNAILPSTSDIGLGVGFKLTDLIVLGVGMSYRMGWGTINHIRISNEGIGLRTYMDIKLKGSIWISGGYEQNYFKNFAQIPALKDFSKWQQSGLIGLSKKYKIGKKTSNMQLLYDFFYQKHFPQSQPLLFRVGYNL